MTSMKAFTRFLNVLNTPSTNPSIMGSPSIPNTPSSLITPLDHKHDIIKQNLSCLASQPKSIVVDVPSDQASQQEQLPSPQHHVTEMQEKMRLMEEQFLA